MRIRDEKRIGAEFLEVCTNTFEFVGYGLAGELELAHSDGAGGRGRSIAPERVDGIAVDRDQFGAGGGTGLSQFFGLLAGVQPRIVTKLGALAQILIEPLLGRMLHQVLYRKNIAVDLRVRLCRVTAVNEERRTVVQDDCGSCRAGKAGEPGQAFFALRQIFVLLAIAARHDEAVEAAPSEFATQFADARSRFVLARSNRRRTESGLRTSPDFNAPHSCRNAGMRFRHKLLCVNAARSL